MNIVDKVIPHKKIQNIMYCNKDSFERAIQNTKINDEISYEIINIGNYRYYQPNDDFFNLEKLITGTDRVFIGASIRGQPAGFAGLIFKGGESCYFKIFCDAYFEGLYTFATFRNQGVMSNLVYKLYIQYLKENDIMKLAICVRPDNTNAIHLYERWGFKFNKKVIFWIKKGIIVPHYTV